MDKKMRSHHETMDSDRTLVRTDDHLSTTLEGEEVILHRDTETYFGLNEVGTRLWELLNEPHTVDDLIATIHDEFDVSKQRSSKDVQRFLVELEAVDLIEEPDDATP